MELCKGYCTSRGLSLSDSELEAYCVQLSQKYGLSTVHYAIDSVRFNSNTPVAESNTSRLSIVIPPVR